VICRSDDLMIDLMTDGSTAVGSRLVHPDPQIDHSITRSPDQPIGHQITSSPDH